MSMADKIQELIVSHIQNMESDTNRVASIDALIMHELRDAIMQELRSPEMVEKLRSLVSKRLTDKVVTDAVNAAFTRG